MAETTTAEKPEELRMSLFEHLGELRSRLLKCSIAVLLLGGVSLFYARQLFEFLMKPVLRALPADMPALVYTSAIENINVLLKVGLYAGIFFTTPIILWQIWGFVAPGLYPSERRYAYPFIFAGTIAFIIGTTFCYLMVLPTMFEFLLQEEATAALSHRIDTAGLREQEAVRFLRIGDAAKAGQVAKAASDALGSSGEGAVHADVQLGEGLTELTARLAGLGRMVDAVGAGFAPGDKAIITKVMDERMAAIDALEKGDYDLARAKLDDGAALLASVAPASALELGNVWQLEKDMALGRARYASENWTKPMLSMKEQLSLVLMLELAFGMIFELPLIMAVLGLVGILKARFLLKYQRHAFVFCMFVAALVTPTGDPINMSLMAGPMFLCFEIGALAVWLIERRRNRNAATTAIEPLK